MRSNRPATAALLAVLSALSTISKYRFDNLRTIIFTKQLVSVKAKGCQNSHVAPAAKIIIDINGSWAHSSGKLLFADIVFIDQLPVTMLTSERSLCTGGQTCPVSSVRVPEHPIGTTSPFTLAEGSSLHHSAAAGPSQSFCCPR